MNRHVTGDESHSPWRVDPETLTQLRIERAESELTAGRYSSALVEAEELLTEHPNHGHALQLVASAALRMGDAILATEAYLQLLSSQTPDSYLLSGLSVALFGQSRLEEARERAHQAIEMDSDNPQAWHCLALVLERTGHGEQAREAFARANQSDPDLYPLPSELHSADLDAALEQAHSRLDPPSQAFYAKVPIGWAEFPNPDELCATTPPLSPFVEALYEGTPEPSRDPWQHLPSRVQLFVGNLAWGETRGATLAQRIETALTREAHHWLGIRPFVNEASD